MIHISNVYEEMPDTPGSCWCWARDGFHEKEGEDGITVKNGLDQAVRSRVWINDMGNITSISLQPV